MIDLDDIGKSIEIRYNKPIFLNLIGVHNFREEGYVVFSVSAEYFVKRILIRNRRVNVIIQVRELKCWSLLSDYVLDELQSRIRMQITKDVPEASDVLDISIITGENIYSNCTGKKIKD